MIWIFGVQDAGETRERGRFFCPACRSEQPFVRKAKRQAISVFFIPVLKFGEASEYVECLTCHSRMDPRVLKR